MSKSLRIVLAQINLLVGDIEGNTKQIIEAAKHARYHLGADIVVFPELSLTGYPPEDLLFRRGLSALVEQCLAKIRDEITGIDVVVGYPCCENEKLYNAVAVLREGQVVARYFKQCLPNYSVFDEKRYFDSGTKACVYTLKGIQIGLTICEDIWFPEPINQAVSEGAELIININASPYHMSKDQERHETLQQRVKEAKVPIVYVNMVGGQDELVFDGASFVINKKGKVIFQAPSFDQGLFLAEIDINNSESAVSKSTKKKRKSELENVYKALVVGVRDYVDKNHFPGAILGLSGGIDSALTLAIAVDALGADRVEAVMMPSRYTSDMSTSDAKKEAENLGVQYHILPIEKSFTAMLDTLADVFKGTKEDVTEENLQARCRGVLLMAISNKKNKMVLTTGNKSEMAVGYATLYGDMAGGYNALKDVPKTLVYRLAEYRNTLSPVIPQSVIHRAPTAELAPNQKDADSLPDYGELDSILELYIEEDKSVDEIVAKGFKQKTVQRVIRMVDNSEYKRRQAAPGVRISRRAFGRDRRYPITSGYNKS